MADEELKRFLVLMAEHDLEEMEVEREGLRVRFRKRAAHAAPVTTGGPPQGPEAGALSAPASADPGRAVGPRVIRAPIVGTVYRAPAPDEEPFVDVGDRVRKGQVLCLIEAMKLMHEIDAEEDGTVVGVFIENGQAVEYGERLLAIDPAEELAP